MIIGAHQIAARIAETVRSECGIKVVLIDTNARNILRAREVGLTAWQADALEIRALREREQLDEFGTLLALTDNPELNRQLADRWAGVFGRQHVFGWFAGECPSRLPAQAAVLDAAGPPGLISRELRDGVAHISVLAGYGPNTARMIGIEVLAVLGRTGCSSPRTK